MDSNITSERKKIIVFGGSGYIGRSLCRLLDNKADVTIITRSDASHSKRLFQWDYSGLDKIIPILEGAYAIINLSGAGVADKRWSKNRKKLLEHSRIQVTRLIVEAVNKLNKKPQVFIQGSAIGYYPHRSSEAHNESSPKGAGYLSGLVDMWEKSTDNLDSSVRKVIIRTGIVIGSNDKLLSKLRITFNLFLGGHIGNGKQYVSWIHIQDQIEAINFLLYNENSQGIYNLCSENPVTMKTFCKTYGKCIKRPSWLHAPSIVFRLVYGEMATETLLSDQVVIPERIIKQGYSFIYPDIESALSEIVENRK